MYFKIALITLLTFSNLGSVDLKRALFCTENIVNKKAKTNSAEIIVLLKNKEIVKAKELIKESLSITCTCRHLLTRPEVNLEYLVSYFGQLGILKTLIKEDSAIINRKEKVLELFNYAALSDQINIIEYLLSLDLKFKDEILSEIYYYAIGGYGSLWIRKLIEFQKLPKNYEYIILKEAIKNDIWASRDLVLENYKDKIDPVYFFENQNLLHISANYGDKFMLDKLLATERLNLNNIDFKDSLNRSALEWAEYNNRNTPANTDDYQNIINRIKNYKKYLKVCFCIIKTSNGKCIPDEIAQKIASYSFLK